MEAINLHFTGSFHAITAAHNLLEALIDNHLHWGDLLGLAPLEAGACNTPVVAVAEGGVRKLVVDGVNGLPVDASPAAFSAAALTRLRDNSAFAIRVG